MKSSLLLRRIVSLYLLFGLLLESLFKRPVRRKLLINVWKNVLIHRLLRSARCRNVRLDVGLSRYQSGITEIDHGVQPALKFFSSLFELSDEWLPDFTFYDDGGIANAQVTDPITGSSGPLTRPDLKIGRKLVKETLSVAKGNYSGSC